MTNKALQDFARTTKITYGNIKKIYNHMEAHKQPDSPIELKLLEETVQWMEANGIKTFEQYEDSYNKSLEIMRKATSLDRTEVSDDDLRKKLGYNNSQWKILKGLEKTMSIELKKLIIEFISSAVVNNKNLKPEEVLNDLYYKELDLRWRNFSRNYLIPNYPGANKNKDLRTRITGLFSTKLLEALDRKVSPEKGNTPDSNEVEVVSE